MMVIVNYAKITNVNKLNLFSEFDINYIPHRNVKQNLSILFDSGRSCIDCL